MPVELKIPEVGESISEVEIGGWLKSVGDAIGADEPVVELETDKATVELPAPAAGVLKEILKETGEAAAVGEVIGYMDEGAVEAQQESEPAGESESGEATPAREQVPGHDTGTDIMPAAQRLVSQHGLDPEVIEGTGPGGKILKEDVVRHLEASGQAPKPTTPEKAPEKAPEKPAQETPEKAEPAPPTQPPKPEADEETAQEASQPVPQAPPAAAETKEEAPAPQETGERREEKARLSPLRRRIAERLVEAQQTAALLTTFNEVNMGPVKALREEVRDEFLERYGVKLGFMSFFVKASVEALKAFPTVNAEVRGEEMIVKHYYDIGIAVSSAKGLMVPVLRDADRMSLADVEKAIAGFAARAKDNKIALDELEGGTFTISNGGVFGSMLSTPIVNPPQSGILGMHAIEDRPVAEDGQVVVRPMMYVALTYDHRIIDGREAVSFLRTIKERVEKPATMLL